MAAEAEEAAAVAPGWVAAGSATEMEAGGNKATAAAGSAAEATGMDCCLDLAARSWCPSHSPAAF